MEDNKNNIVVENNEPVTLNVKKPKKKGKKIFLFLFLLLLIAAGVCTWYVMNNENKDNKETKHKTEEKDKKKEKKKDTKKEEKKEDKDDSKNKDIVLYFYNDGSYVKVTDDYDKIEDKKNIISKYMCEGTCSVLDDDYFAPGMTDGTNPTNVMINKKAFFKDNDHIILFDVEEGKVIGTYGNKAFWLNGKNSLYSSLNGRYIEIIDQDNKYYGIIDCDGNQIHEFNIDAGSKVNNMPMYQSYYSIEGDYIVSSKDGKYGITRITSNNVVIDYQYDDIRIIDDQHFKVLENGKWYIYYFVSRNKAIDTGFDFIFGVFEDVVIVSNDSKIYIKDFQGNDVIATPIENTASELKEQLEVDNLVDAGVYFEKDSYKLKICVTKNNKLDKTYLYNIATKTLEKE